MVQSLTLPPLAMYTFLDEGLIKCEHKPDWAAEASRCGLSKLYLGT